MTQRPKRPRDPAQLAKLIIDIASGEVEDRHTAQEEQGKSPSRVARGKTGGPKGGKARALKLTPEQRADIARLAAHPPIYSTYQCIFKEDRKPRAFRRAIRDVLQFRSHP